MAATKKYFKLITQAAKTDGKMAICEVVKVDGVYRDSGWFNSVSGRATGFYVKEFSNFKSYSIKLQKGESVEYLSFMLGFTTFSIINSLLNTDLSKEIQISAWVNKKGFVQASVGYVGGADKIDWAIEISEQPQVEKSESGKTDYSKVNDFWDAKFTSLSAETKQPVELPIESVEDDLPF